MSCEGSRGGRGERSRTNTARKRETGRTARGVERRNVEDEALLEDHSAATVDGSLIGAANVWRQRRAKRVRCTPGLGNGMGGKARTCARQRCRAVAGVLKNGAEGGSDARAGSPGGGQTLSRPWSRDEYHDGRRKGPRGGLAGGAALPPCRTGGKGVEGGEA